MPLCKDSELEQLFDKQIFTLQNMGLPEEEFLRHLRLQRSFVINKAKDMDDENGRIPFLPVFPLSWISPHLYEELLTSEYLPDEVYHNEIRNRVSTPNKPYYVYNVDMGDTMRSVTPETAKRLLGYLEKKRRGLTVAEAFALAVHTDVLSRLCLTCLGSYYRHVLRTTPILKWCNSGPRLSSCLSYSSYTNLGSPSCDAKATFSGKRIA